MHPVVAILACYGIGLVLLLARGLGRDPLLAAALALPVGAAVSAVLAFAFVATGVPLTLPAYGAAWCALLAIGGWAARRDVDRLGLWHGPAALAAAYALVAIAASRFDVAVVSNRSHDVLLFARVLAGGGEIPSGSPDVSGLGTSLHAAFYLVSPDHALVLVPVLALSGLVALGALLARMLPIRRRRTIAVAATLALATSFPMLRSLLTVGSPAVAGIMLLAFGGLWYASELAGDRRPLPLAVAALAAFALHGRPFALAAVIALVVMAISTRLARARFAWRLAAVRAHPAFRLVAAGALACLAAATTATFPAGALAVAPLAVLAVVLLVAGRNPPHDVEIGEPLLTRADLQQLVTAWIAGVAIVSVLEWGLLVAQNGDQFSGLAQQLRLLPLDFGNLLPYGLIASILLIACEVTSDVLAGRRWPRLTVGAAVGLLVLPYAAWLARFTFSGPQAREMAHRPLLVGATALLVATSFAALVWFAAVRRTDRRWPAAVLAGAVIGSASSLVLSRVGLHNEYEPLHQFLGVLSILLAALAGRELSRMVRLVRAPREPAGRFALALTAAAALWTMSAGAVLARSHGDAWLLWGETGASRYLTRRWSFLTPSPDLAALGADMVIKPQIESEETRALRARRAAAPAPHIVLFSIDGLRPDRVGAYGCPRPITPNIDRFAARGVRFTRAYSSFPATQAFNTSLLFGRYVERTTGEQQPQGYVAQAITNLLDRRHYHTFVKGWFEQALTNALDPVLYNLDTYAPKARNVRRLEEPMDRALARLAPHLDQARQRDLPVFVWIHVLATHPMKGQGFVPHPDFDFGRSRMGRYESAIAGSDLWLRGIEELMASRLDPARPVIWIILSDHGIHEGPVSRDLREGVVRVPLVVVAPGVAPRADDRLVDVSLDLAATVVDLAGIAPPPEYDGISLVPLLLGLPAPAMDQRLVPLHHESGWSGAIHGRFKYLRLREIMSLFDVSADPAEQRNLVAQEFDRTYRMRQVTDGELARRARLADEARIDRP
jgi:Sulfatase